MWKINVQPSTTFYAYCRETRKILICKERFVNSFFTYPPCQSLFRFDWFTETLENMVFGLRPNLPNSIDGEPLTVQISDLVTSFPYDRLPENPFVSFFMRPEVPFILVILYLASKSTITSICSTFGITGKSDTFKYCVAAHNFSLAIFSLIVVGINKFSWGKYPNKDWYLSNIFFFNGL